MPTYPTTVTGLGILPPQYLNGGPYAYNGARYIISTDAAFTPRIAVMKSTDNGQTWTEVDAGNSPSMSVAVGITSSNTCPDADFPTTPKIYVVYIRPTANQFTLKSFDFSTDTWGTAINSTLGFTAGVPSPNISDNMWYPVHRGSDNKVVVACSSVKETVSGQPRWRMQYFTCDLGGSSWSAYTQFTGETGVNANFRSNGICINPDTNLVHFFYRQESAVSPFPVDFLHATLDTSGTFTGNEVIESFASNNTSTCIRVIGKPVVQGSGADQIINVPFKLGNVGVTPYTYFVSTYRAISQVTPTWTRIDIVSGAGRVTGSAGDLPTNPTMFNVAGVLKLMYGFNSFDSGGSLTAAEIDTSESNDQGLTWTSPSTFYSVPALGSFAVDQELGGAEVDNAAAEFAFFAELSNGIDDDLLDYWEGVVTPVPPAPAEVINQVAGSGTGQSRPASTCHPDLYHEIAKQVASRIPQQSAYKNCPPEIRYKRKRQVVCVSTYTDISPLRDSISGLGFVQRGNSSRLSSSLPPSVPVSFQPTTPTDSDVSTHQTIAKMHEHVSYALNHPAIQREIAEIKYRLPEYATDEDVIEAVWDHIRETMRFKTDEELSDRYFGIPTGIELLANPSLYALGEIREGDCDDFAMRGKTLLAGLGVAANFTTVAVDKDFPDRWSHVYLTAYPRSGKGRVGIPLDLSHGKHIGWEVQSYTRKKEWDGSEGTEMIMNSAVGGLGAIDWGSIVSTGFQTGFDIAKSVLTPPQYQTTTSASGASQTTVRGGTPTGAASAAINANLNTNTLLLGGIGIVALLLLLGKKR